MIKLKLIIYFLILLIFASCGTIKEGFSNQKKDNTDEFLVEKKNPLKLPPDYEKLPLPNSGNVSEKDENNNDIIDFINSSGRSFMGSHSSTNFNNDSRILCRNYYGHIIRYIFQNAR